MPKSMIQSIGLTGFSHVISVIKLLTSHRPLPTPYSHTTAVNHQAKIGAVNTRSRIGT